ncbi:MAG: hypothetical protein WBP93_15770 [Pyrinomonadaceae bacterium]
MSHLELLAFDVSQGQSPGCNFCFEELEEHEDEEGHTCHSYNPEFNVAKLKVVIAF